MLKMKNVYFIILGSLFLMGALTFCTKPAVSQQCLKQEPKDSKTFGQALAVNEKYLAIGDPDASQVVIYKREANNQWSRLQVISPPKDSISNDHIPGFGYALDFNDDILIVGAYDSKGQLSNRSQFSGSIYFASVGENGINSIQELPIPLKNLVVGYSLSLFNNQLAFAGKSEVVPGRWIERIMIADLGKRQISRVIGAPQRPEESQSWPQLESPISVDFDAFGPSLDSYKKSLLIGVTGAPPKGGIYLMNETGNVEQLKFSATGLYPLSVAGTSVGLAENTIGLGRSGAFGSSDTIIFKRSQQGWFLVDQVDMSGPLYVHDSYVLISMGQVRGMPASSNRPEHLLVEVGADGIVSKREVRWQKGSSFPIQANGIIDRNNLILSAGGRVVQIPIKNLHQSSDIRDCN